MPTPFELAQLNQQFEQATAQEIMAWSLQTFPNGLVCTSSFSTLAVPHMLYRELCPQPPVPVVFLDTLHHFPETLDTVERARQHYSLDLRIYRARGVSSREAFAARYGSHLWQSNITRFHYLTKVEPLERALKELQVSAWLTGRRRDQSVSRRHMPILEFDPQGRLKINPLATWTHKQLWTYTYNRGVIYNPLHDQGFTSIGDQPLTTPVAPGEHERAGRWRGSTKTECGIHG